MALCRVFVSDVKWRWCCRCVQEQSQVMQISRKQLSRAELSISNRDKMLQI